jgi:transposase-like protein
VSMQEQKKRCSRRSSTDAYKARAVRLVLKRGQTAVQVGCRSTCRLADEGFGAVESGLLGEFGRGARLPERSISVN